MTEDSSVGSVFKLCNICCDVMVRANVGTCSWCAERVRKGVAICFNCNKPLDDTDFTGAHRDKSVCIRQLRLAHRALVADNHRLSEENHRLRDMTNRTDPIRCFGCGEIRERAEQMCGNCGAELH